MEKYCWGQRYNFKKGRETCPKKESCVHWQKYYVHQKACADMGKPEDDLAVIKFDTIKDFRECSHYLENTVLDSFRAEESGISYCCNAKVYQHRYKWVNGVESSMPICSKCGNFPEAPPGALEAALERLKAKKGI